ncbi:DUF2059 domain-containing protein [Flavobacterium lacus]|jgi:uncharacterized protein|uniref:DUF2059 domain-containing protein n=1 Tax=Flavobacterium lacus TaxID=1353778 RepID=A0A328WU22_9FLAO|nr:DUF2059 domain-containing protein [Flavobacterium lacus]RAR49682.1 hypothetical protein B0I10_103103 [Flavobacterium lacus]
MKKTVLTFALLLITTLGFSQDAFKNDVVKYLEVSGQSNTFKMITKDLASNIPEAKKAEFQKELDASINDLMGKMADMYMTEFTHDDVKALLKFYESPAGKKLTDKTEVLYNKGQTVGQEWGMGLQTMMMKYMQ